MAANTIYAQGDILLERVADVDEDMCKARESERDPDGAVVLARGEVSGHRHAFHGGALMFRDDALARDMPAELYIGHVKVSAPSADLVHEEHGAIRLPTGTYRVRRQREYRPGTLPRAVED